MKRFLLLSLAVLVPAAIAVAGSRSKENKVKPKSKPEVVPSIDLNRYQGKWYEIARFPNRFEKSCASDVTATYTLAPDGKLNVLNECRKPSGERKQAEGKARRASKDGPTSKLEVRF